MHEFEAKQQEQEALNTMSVEEMQKAIEALSTQNTKEYVYEVKDKDINAKLQAPITKRLIPKTTYMNIKKDTHQLCQNGFHLIITNDLINEVIEHKNKTKEKQ